MQLLTEKDNSEPIALTNGFARSPALAAECLNWTDVKDHLQAWCILVALSSVPHCLPQLSFHYDVQEAIVLGAFFNL